MKCLLFGMASCGNSMGAWTLMVLYVSLVGVCRVASDGTLSDVFSSMENNQPKVSFDAGGQLRGFIQRLHARLEEGRPGSQEAACRQKYPVGDQYGSCPSMTTSSDVFVSRHQTLAQLDHIGDCILNGRTLTLRFHVTRDDVSSVQQARLFIPTARTAGQARIKSVCYFDSNMEPMQRHCEEETDPFQLISSSNNACSPINVMAAYETAITHAASYLELTVELNCQQCAGTLSGYPYVLVDYTSHS